MRDTRLAAFLLTIVTSGGFSTPSAAEQTAQVGYWNGTTRKLGRGLANVVSAPLELIRTPYFVGHQDGGLSSLTVGLVQGVGAAVVRELAGIVEVVTFFAPVPKKEFQPIVRPEFVYGHGDWLP